MSLVVKQSATTFAPAPSGAHPARLVWIVDLGTQATIYGDRKQILLAFELVDEPLTEERNFLISKFYGASLAKNAALRAVITGLTGAEPAEIDMEDLLDKPCIVNVAHAVKADATYANLQSVTACPRDMTVSSSKAPKLAYDMDDPSDEAYQALPEWIKKKISCAKSPAAAVLGGNQTTGIPAGPSFEDIPF